MHQTATDTTDGFAALGLRPELLGALAGLGYEEPTPIQCEAVPLLLQGRDLVGQAATGTGKTAAFALPILQRIQRGGRAAPFALVLVPTRELAVQVAEAIGRYGTDLGARVVAIYGGQPIRRQIEALARGVHVVVATPGRALDHITRGTLVLGGVAMVVLDEADEMLDMGFAEDIEAILAATPAERQTVLFSATMPPRINGIARRHLREPARVKIGLEAAQRGARPLVRHVAYVVARAHKTAALGRLLDVETPAATIVFCRTRTEVEELTEALNGSGHRAEALHGGMSQEQRDRVMGRLRAGSAELLVATDVAARGLDLEQLSHVINYDVPAAPESYVHRVGRVGRAGRAGVAMTLAEPRERGLLANIERLTRLKIAIEKVPTVADLRARQMQHTLGLLREALTSDDLEQFAAVVDPLAGEVEMRDIALAAVQLAHRARGVTMEAREIPEAGARDERGRERWQRPVPVRPSHAGARPRRGSSGGTANLYVGVGRSAGIRPADLVGAIANETHLSGRDIGPISISERYSIVGIPTDAVDGVIAAMQRTTFKGRKATIRRYVEKVGHAG
ncbi:MAG TPA: DEAD/DEAH box helicase [Candidatus Dormibacteraeota bacterium]|nr:DEAD/DEAH box helicase [Candidatus Dormibacteraeota bacterium]